MITEYEKKRAEEVFDEIACTLVETNEASAIYKVLANYIGMTNPSKEICYDEKIFDDQERTKEKLKSMFQLIVKVASNNKSGKVYTTGQLSKYFGVSVTSINKWINEGRFIGVDRKAQYKQARISEDAVWRSASGENILVKDIIQEYKAQNEKQKISKEEEKKELLKEITYFEKKYGGKYEDCMKGKANLTYEELQDKQDWEYLQKRIKND